MRQHIRSTPSFGFLKVGYRHLQYPFWINEYSWRLVMWSFHDQSLSGFSLLKLIGTGLSILSQREMVFRNYAELLGASLRLPARSLPREANLPIVEFHKDLDTCQCNSTYGSPRL